MEREVVGVKVEYLFKWVPELLEPYLREFTRTGLHLLPDQYHADNLTSVKIHVP